MPSQQLNIVLIRGLAREASHWGRFAGDIRKRLDESPGGSIFDNINVFAFDYAGCGRFFDDTAYTSISKMTEHVRNQWLEVNDDSSGDEGHTVVIGLSMGGMIALDWMYRYPDELNGVVLINSSTADQPLRRRFKPSVWFQSFAALLGSRNYRESSMLKIVSNDQDNYSDNVSRWIHIQQKRPVMLSTIIRLLFAASRFSLPNTRSTNPHGIFRQSPVPGIVLASKADRLVSYRCSEVIAHDLQWPLLLHVSAGHDLPLDEPEWVINNICSWLSQITPHGE